MIFEATTRKKMRKDPTSTWIARTFDEYVDLFKAHNLMLESHFCINSPFYGYMMLPYNLVRYRLSIPNNNKIELIYSELAVMITKYLDKRWQRKNSGLLHCIFRKEGRER